MATVYIIDGGGQRIRENASLGIDTYYKVEDNDFEEQSKSYGCDAYTGKMWANDLDTLQKWANSWAGKEVNLKEQNKNY